jgi:hypothetical protein
VANSRKLESQISQSIGPPKDDKTQPAVLVQSKVVSGGG